VCIVNLAMIQYVIGNGVQLVSSLGTPKVMSDAQIFSIQGALLGSKSIRNFPILISTHYDSMSPAAVRFPILKNGIVQYSRSYYFLFNL
jgi:hypothetical protein